MWWIIWCRSIFRLVDKLIEECTENIGEVKLSCENEHKNKCSSWILCIALFSILFTINVGIGTYFVYYKYLNHWYLKKDFVSKLVPVLKQRFEELINGKSKTNRDQTSNLLFLQRHDQSQKSSTQTC